MSSYIEPAQNIGEAWVRTLEAVHGFGGYAINVISTVIDPLASEDPCIRRTIDSILIEGYRSGTRIQSVDTVAGTIFPFDLYGDPGFSPPPASEAAPKAVLDMSASDLYQSYIEMLPILLTDPANSRGTYLSRMVSWPGNLLELSRLLAFLAQHTGYEVGELVVHATMADAEYDTYTKAEVTELISTVHRGDAP